MAVVLTAGFASGMPLYLTGRTLQAWMVDEKVDLSVIGIFWLVGLPYAFKFLWSPLLDRFVPGLMGRRRGWMLLSQLALVATIAGMAFCGPSQHPLAMALLAVLVTFFSASQDIVIDAYRTELLTPLEYETGASMHVMGYRIGMLVSGAASMALADYIPWQAVYLLMAATMGIGIANTLLAPEPASLPKPPQTLQQAVVQPLVEFLRRRGAIEMAAFIFLYKLDVYMADVMATPFLQDCLGFTKSDLALVYNVFALLATIGGAMAGAAVMARLRLSVSLLAFGLLQGFSGLSFTVLALLGHNYPMMVAAVAVESFFTGMSTAAFVAFIMSLCSKRYTATQYALLSSLMGLGRVLIGVPAGYLAKWVNWPTYFIIATLIAIPGLVLLVRFPKWQRSAEPAMPTDDPDRTSA